MPDPRGHSNAQRHALHDILVIALCATLCGATSFVEMEEFGQAKFDWLRGPLGLELPSGVPSHDTFGRVLAALDPQAFASCFRKWTQEIQRRTQGQIVAVDGKTLRRSFDTASGRAAIHMVSAWANRSGLVLGQLAVAAKSNEITAVPGLLALLDLTGCIVTVDALNCQRAAAAQIVAQGGDYLFALKENHPWLHQDVASHFAWALQRLQAGTLSAKLFASQYDDTSFGHGRHEQRRCWCVDAASEDWAAARRQWPGLRSIILVERRRAVQQVSPEHAPRWSQASCQRQYYLSSLAPDARHIAPAVREHWGIENRLHWALDVSFDEDRSRIRKDHAAINMATLRHICLNLLRQDTSHKRGLKARLHRAGWDNNYLLRLLAGPEP